MLVKCDHCKGMKQIMGLGNMMQDCMYCEGIGHHKIANDDSTLNQAIASNLKSKPAKPKLVLSDA